MLHRLIGRGAVASVAGVLICLSPMAVASATEHVQASSEPGQWLHDYLPVGTLVAGIVGVLWRFLAAIRPKVEAWLDAGMEERVAMRDLAVDLKRQFSDDAVDDRETLKAAIAEIRAEREKRE